MIESFKNTTAGSNQLIFRVDDDDEETAGFLKSYPYTMVIGPRHQGYRSLPQYLQDMVPFTTGEVLMVGNDDMVFETPEWDRLVLEEANRYPDGLFNLGVETLNASHFPFSIISKGVVDTLGWVYDPRLLWGDIYLRDLMAHFGRAIPLCDVKVTHEWAGFKPDHTFAEANSLKTSIGTPEYWKMHRELVNEAIEKLLVGAKA